MRNKFVKILCLSLIFIMLLSACNTTKVETPSVSTPDNTTEAPGGTTPPENLFSPVSSKQVIFNDEMKLEDYISGLGTGIEMSLDEIDGNTVVKFTCKKKASSNIVFDYAKYMNEFDMDLVLGSEVTSVVFMIRKTGSDKFQRILASADEAITLADDGTVSKISLDVFSNMKKNNEWYLSSFALASNSEDIIKYSDLSMYALGYNSNINIQGNNVAEHKPLTAPNEDASVKLWFDHITERVTRYTVAPTNMVSYTIEMGKNEYEGCQFFLHSPTNKKINIALSTFTNASGDTLETELGVEFYIEEGWLPIKGYSSELVYPDAVVPYASYISQTSGGNYEDGPWVTIGPYTYKGITKDTSQGFVIQAKTTADSKPGLYTATLEIFDAETGECIKMAEVYTYVYNVTLSDEPALDTAFLVWDGSYANQYNGNQQAEALIALFDFMLDYRVTPTLSGWVVNDLLCPGGNYEWLYNPRVTTIRVHTKAQYEAWSCDPILAEKIYYYGQDEPGVARGFYREVTLEDGSKQSFWDPYGIFTVIGIAEEAKMLRNVWGWEDYKLLVPFERNPSFTTLHKYPGIDYGTTIPLSWEVIELSLETDPNEARREQARALLEKYKDELIAAGDMVSFMSEYVNMWVPILFAYTPTGFDDAYTGCWYVQSAAQDATFGEFADRLEKYVERGDEKWTYVACNPTFTSPYQSLLLFCDGTRAETMFWTCYREDITGFLYWHISNYGIDSKANDNFTLRCPLPKENAGDGILVYPGSTYGQIDPIPSIRLISLRDGIEDYELLTMLEGVRGEAYAKELASFISTSVRTYTEDDATLRTVRSYMLQILEAELNK